MLFHYALQDIDTGKNLFSEYSEKGMLSWHRRAEKKLLKDGRRSEELREVILNQNTIVALLNYEEVGYVSHIFRGYDKFFNDRLIAQTNR